MSAKFTKPFLSKFREPLTQAGFAQKPDLTFVQGEMRALRMLVFRSGYVYSTRRYEFDCMVGVHYHDVEKLMRPDLLADLMPTISSPICYLRPNGSARDTWCLEDEGCVDDVLSQIREFALPFFDRFVALDDLQRHLESEWPSGSVGTGPDGRLLTLICIHYLRGEKNAARKMVEEILAERKDARPAKWWDFKKLNERLFPTGE